jgi:glycosyltransferase involved in cell wall biosynthesis
VYDCDQDWLLLPILWESVLTSRADLVLAASPGLADHLSPCNDHIVVVPNGFRYERYAPERLAGLHCPTDLAQIREPVFGYAGTVWSNLNLRPVYTAVRAHPEWHFVIVGKCSKKNRYLKALRTYPNFHLLGPKSPSELPAYIKHFTVGTSFLREDMEDNDILSPRIYEYLATGIPVVSMYHHLHKEEFPQLIDSAYSEKQFVSMCEKVLTDDTLLRRAQRMQEAEKADWSHRCQQVQRLVLEGHLFGD